MKAREGEQFVVELSRFLGTGAAAVPPELSGKVRERIESALHPSPWLVLTKLTGIVFASGLFILTLCPQFGVGFARRSGLFELFMSFGHYGCHFFCGAFFLGTGLLIAAFVLREEDLETLRRGRALKIAGMASLALAGFVAAGGTVFFGAAAIWFVGAVVGGIVSFEAGWFLKRQLA